MKVSNEGEAKQLVDWIFPENKVRHEVRQACLRIFADAVAEANIYGRDKWVVKCDSNHIRLQMNGKIKNIIVCTLAKGRIWMALDKGLLGTPNRQPLPEKSGDWEWDTDDYPEYPSISSRNGYYLPSEKHAKVWPGIRRLHFESIYKAASGENKPGAPQNHSPEILKYLRNELGRHVPDPLHQ
jgi:hypothetical protein